MHHVALFSAPLTNDRALGATVDERLDWLSVDLYLNVQHCYMTEELWIVLHRILIILLNHVFANFLLNHFLGFYIVRVSVLKLGKSFLLCSPLFKHRFHSLTDDFFNFLVIARLKS